MNKKHCIRIENLDSDPYSMIFVDGKEYRYCEYAFEVAEVLTRIITDFQNKNENFYFENVEVFNFSEESEG